MTDPEAGGITIHPAQPAHLPLLLNMIRELAAFEGLSHEVAVTEASLHDALFGAAPRAECRIGCLAGEPCGYAVFFETFSTFRGRSCLFVDDLYVIQSRRGHGIGKALLLDAAHVARERGCARMEWLVLNWNRGAVDFYRSLGAEIIPDYRLCRLTAESLQRLS